MRKGSEVKGPERVKKTKDGHQDRRQGELVMMIVIMAGETDQTVWAGRMGGGLLE